MKRVIPYIILIVVLVSLLFLSLKKRKSEKIEETFIAFDTFVQITLYSPFHQHDEIMRKVENELIRIEKTYGYKEGSLADRLSHNRAPIPITPETKRILDTCLSLSELTHGSFDITVGLLEKAWGFKNGEPRLPLREEIDSLLPLIGYEKITLTDSTVSLGNDAIVIDFGGIAKGYAVDRCVEMLKREGIDAGIVDAGGDLRAFGKKKDGDHWTIGIRHPEKPGKVITKFMIEGGAVATSGNYERYFMENEKKYHHIIDPKDGYPPDKCVSVTIIADNALTADALATGIFILGPNDGMQLIERLDGIEGIIISKENGTFTIDVSGGVIQK
jgi:thiamine biosynthesis lipoprotein